MTIRKSPHRVLWYEAVGFGLLIGLTWLDFLFPLPGIIFAPSALREKWEEDLFVSGIIAIVALVVILLTRRLVERLHRLEGLLQVCAWCGRVGDEGRWMPVEDYFAQGFKIGTDHQVCPECERKLTAMGDVAKAKQPAA